MQWRDKFTIMPLICGYLTHICCCCRCIWHWSQNIYCDNDGKSEVTMSKSSVYRLHKQLLRVVNFSILNKKPKGLEKYSWHSCTDWWKCSSKERFVHVYYIFGIFHVHKLLKLGELNLNILIWNFLFLVFQRPS